MDGTLIFAFIGGAVATVNPCGFALLPAYLARRLNTKPGDNIVGVVVQAIGIGAITSSGFVIVFGVVGATISLGAYWMIKFMPWAGFIVGLILILTGMFLLSGRRITLRLPAFGHQLPARSMAGDLFFGIGYGTASLSCTLPIFLAVTGTAITGSLAVSALTFLAYALGMGTVLMVLSISSALTYKILAASIRKAGIYVNGLSGGIMALSGVYVTLYWGVILFLPETPSATGLITYGDKIASPVRLWLGGQVGIITILSLALLISLFLIWASWSRFIRKSNKTKPHQGMQQL